MEASIRVHDSKLAQWKNPRWKMSAGGGQGWFNGGVRRCLRRWGREEVICIIPINYAQALTTEEAARHAEFAS
ncbi:hypothetical protein LguiA_005498 [Lonicera macranthoides]